MRLLTIPVASIEHGKIFFPKRLFVSFDDCAAFIERQAQPLFVDAAVLFDILIQVELPQFAALIKINASQSARFDGKALNRQRFSGKKAAQCPVRMKSRRGLGPGAARAGAALNLGVMVQLGRL